jgi:hypothetical protein
MAYQPPFFELNCFPYELGVLEDVYETPQPVFDEKSVGTEQSSAVAVLKTISRQMANSFFFHNTEPSLTLSFVYSRSSSSLLLCGVTRGWGLGHLRPR